MRDSFQIDGSQSAAAFAFYAFFALFPLIVLMVTVASNFIDRDRAGSEIIAYVEAYVPISGEMHSCIFVTRARALPSSGEAGCDPVLLLLPF